MTIRVLFSFFTILATTFGAEGGMQCREVFHPTLRIEQSIHDLAKLRLNLDLAQSQGNLSPSLNLLKQEYSRKEKEILKYLEGAQLMDRATLIAKIAAEIQKIQNQSHEQDSKDQTQEQKTREEQAREFDELHIDGRQLVFGTVLPGSFKRGTPRTTSKDVTQSYDLAATPTTQIVWRKVVEAAQIKNSERYGKLRQDPSFDYGDLKPLNWVSYDDIQLWIEALNELSASNDPVIVEVLRDHPLGARYRLPSWAEWELVVRNKMEKTEFDHYGLSAEDFEKYAWTLQDGKKDLQPVATKNPMIVDGQAFYDLVGNIKQFTSNPFGLTNQIVVGGDFSSLPKHITGILTFERTKSALVGFRLVRDRNP